MRRTNGHVSPKLPQAQQTEHRYGLHEALRLEGGAVMTPGQKALLAYTEWCIRKGYAQVSELQEVAQMQTAGPECVELEAVAVQS